MIPDRKTSNLLDNGIATGLIVVLVFSGLAHGVVEPWSIFILELMVAVLLLMVVVKAVMDKSLTLVVPQPVWPVIGLVTIGLAQSIVWRDGEGNRQSLSMDVESTRWTVLILFCLLTPLFLERSFFGRTERLDSDSQAAQQRSEGGATR